MRMGSSVVALIGYRGAGKSAVAEQLASLLGREWADADVDVEQRAGKPIAAIFQEQGESVFRDLESEVVADLTARDNLIVAFGGGAVLRADNRAAIAGCQAIVWLRASVETILHRLAGDPTTGQRRPNLTNAGGRREIEQLLAERTPIYEACATLEVDTDGKAPAEIASEISAALGLDA